MVEEFGESNLERLPPQSIEAEQAVLGALLVSGDGVSRVIDLLEPEYFYRKAHQVIYAAMVDLYDANEPIDIITIAQFLKDAGKLDLVGGHAYITDLSLSVATTANLEFYGKIVQEKALLRSLIKAGSEIVGSCYEETDADTALDKAEHMIFTLAQRRNMQEMVHIKHIVENSFQKIEERYENRDVLSGVPSGFYDLDAMTSGFQPSDLVIIAARPSMGKCLAADSEILLSDGSLSTIEAIYKNTRKENNTLLTLNSQYKLELTQPSHFLDDGIKPTFKVTTKLGRKITTTLSHPFLSLSGWKKLQELKVGDQIALPNKLPVFGQKKMEAARVKLLAQYMASPQQTREILALAGSKASEKVDDTVADGLIPKVIFHLEKSQLSLFLSFLLSAGTLSARRAALIYCSANEKQIQQLSHLLLRFGIISHTSRVNAVFELAVTDVNSLTVLQREIGINGKEQELKRIISLAHLDKTRKINGDVLFDEIIAIEEMGEQQVYDLTINETHNFVANDILVHNTAFVLNLAQNCGVEAGVPVAIFSLEMSKESLVQRMLCAEARIDANRLRTGHLHTNDWTALATAMGRLGEAPVYIDDSAMLNVLEIRAKCRRLKAETKGALGMVIIDYIQLMQGRKATDNRVQEVSEISRSLKTLAREINTPVLALSQLSRAVEARQNKRPMLSDLRESGSIEQDADLVMFIYRDEYYNPESDKRGEAEIIIAKQRNGPVGTVDLLYQGSITRFLNKVQNQYPGQEA
jgi:replicative DNA helicase